MTSQLSINGGNNFGTIDSNRQTGGALPSIVQQSAMKQSPSVGEPYQKITARKDGNTFGGTSRSMSVVHPPNGGGRKAIREGLDMLEAKYVQKDSLQKANMLENRIKRLVFEEQRAKKLTDIANEKAEKLLKARDRHQKELEDRMARNQKRSL